MKDSDVGVQDFILCSKNDHRISSYTIFQYENFTKIWQGPILLTLFCSLYLFATLQATVKYNNSPHFDCIDITLKYFKLQVIFEGNGKILYL